MSTKKRVWLTMLVAGPFGIGFGMIEGYRQTGNMLIVLISGIFTLLMAVFLAGFVVKLLDPPNSNSTEGDRSAPHRNPTRDKGDG